MTSKLFITLCAIALFLCNCSKDNTTSRTPPKTYQVKVTSDVKYGSNKNWLGDNEQLLLDIYSPKTASASTKFPLVVLVHGGTFLTGNKSNMQELANELSDQGFIVASIDYRLGWDIGNVDCAGDTTSSNEAVYRGIQDLNASIRFLVSNADKYFINTDWVFTGGASAGGIASLNAAYLSDAYMQNRNPTEVAKLGGLHDATNNLTTTYTIKGICSMWGGLLDDNLLNASTAIPCIAFHGTADQTIPVNTGFYSECPNYQKLWGSEYIYNQLTALSVPVVYHVYQGEGHGPVEYTPEYIANNTACFFKSLMAGTAHSGTYQKMASSCE